MSRRLPHCKLRTISFLFTSRPLSPWWTKWPAGATAVSLPFTLTVDVVLALISIFLLLPHSRLIIPLMDHKNHCALHHLCGSMCVCVCVLTSSNCCVEIPPKPLEGFFLSWLYPLVECPISFSLIPFPDPQTPAALMWHHRKVYLAGTHVWSEHRGKAGWCLYLAGEELNQNVVNEHIKCEPHDKRKIKIIQLP